jgi:hypothetical protein
MKHNYATLILLFVNFVLLSNIGCQSTEKKLEAALEAQLTPIITFDKVAHDFGEIGPDQKITTEFKFTNSGNGLLIINEVDSCCGVTATLDKKEYALGESGTLKINYASSKYLGSVTKRLYVYSNDKAKPKIALTLKAEIVPKVAWEPQSFKLFLNGNNIICPKITVSSLDNQPFSIAAFKSTLNCITADVDSSVKAAKFVLKPKINTDKIQENMRGFIHISLTHPEWKTVTIPFDVPPKFTIKPAQIIILNAEPNKPMQRSVRIVNNYAGDFEVETMSSQNNLIRLLSQTKVENSYQFELEINPPNVEGQGQVFTDILLINIKGGQKIEIPCRGFYLIKE